jgi:lipoprotein-anchoring transpeptidase ErfK/SrfK
MSEFKPPHVYINRRAFLGASAASAATAALAGCTTIDVMQPGVPGTTNPGAGNAAQMYAARVDDGFQLPAIPYQQIDPRFLRQQVNDPTGSKPGTIVVDTSAHFLYYVQAGGKAMRYGVALGKPGFEWQGNAVVQWKQKWPRWTPPPEMIKRRPELEKYSAENGGMPPGPDNPLGARALYIFKNGKDTFYRLHGTPEWNSIGKNASSGCVRLMNQDVIDLYDRVAGATPITVGAGVGGYAVAAAASGMSATAARKGGDRTTAIDAGVPRDAVLLQ